MANGGGFSPSQQYEVLRLHRTEIPGSSPLDSEKRKGTFSCAGCSLALFSSETKYDSKTGWPSFYRPLPNAIGTATDYVLLVPRTEVHCRRCGGHLGHVFHGWTAADGPALLHQRRRPDIRSRRSGLIRLRGWHSLVSRASAALLRAGTQGGVP